MRRSYIPENKFVLHPPFPFIFLVIKIVRKRCCYRQPLSTDGVNGLITPLLINEWKKCFQCQPVSSVSPSPCGAVRVVQPLGSAQPTAVPGIHRKSCGSVPIRRLCGAPMQVRQDVARCWLQTPGLFWSPFVVPLNVLPQGRCSLLGRCWIAQVCSAGSRCPPRCSVGIGVARSLSGASPGDTAGPDAAWLSPGGAQQKPVDTKLGGKMEAVQMFMPCSFDSLCLWVMLSRGTVSRLLRDWFGAVEVVFWELKIPCLGLATVLYRAPAAGLTGSDRDGGFQEGKTHNIVFKYIYIYISSSETSWQKHRSGLTETQFCCKKTWCIITIIIWKSLRIL